MIKYFFAVGIMAAGCQRIEESITFQPVPRTDYNSLSPRADFPTLSSLYGQTGLIVQDTDGDGLADHFNPAYKISSRLMCTPEIQAATTRFLQANKDLAILVDQRVRELQQGDTK